MKWVVFFFLFSFFVNTGFVYAAKKTLPQSTSGKPAVSKIGGGLPTVSPRLRKDRHALVVYFGNLGNTESISYTLIYTTNNKEEGVAGSINPNGLQTVNRELLFGTCSSGVCRYHTNISNMKFEAIIHLTSGKQITKRYKVRV